MLIVIKSTVVERVKVFDENMLYQLRLENEIDGLCEDVESA